MKATGENENDRAKDENLLVGKLLGKNHRKKNTRSDSNINVNSTLSRSQEETAKAISYSALGGAS